jgi:hypothetical protein
MDYFWSFQHVADGEYRFQYDNGFGDYTLEIMFKVNGNQLQYTWHRSVVSYSYDWADNYYEHSSEDTISLTLERVSATPDEPIDPSLVVPEPAPDANNVDFEPDEKIVLKATLPTLPEDTVITGGKWEIYFADPNKEASKALIHILEENHGGLAHEGESGGEGENNTYTYEVPVELEEADYVWRVKFHYEKAGKAGETQWSTYATFSIEKILSDNISGGGCDVGFGFFAVGIAALAYLHRKGRNTK